MRYENPLTVAVVVGSTRPGRRASGVADWVAERVSDTSAADVAVLDLVDHDLPLLDEEMPPIMGAYTQDHTKAWAAAVDPVDAFVFVTPEYNRSAPAALKNAIDFLYAEWRDKAAGFVSYGVDAGGARAVEHLRGVMAEVHVATVRDHVALSLNDDFTDGRLTPRAHQSDKLDALLGQLMAWGGALRTLRVAA